MTLLTPLQISEQAARFELFLKTANLVKIAETWVSLDSPKERGTYLRRVLWNCARVGSSFRYPSAGKFYEQILVINALSALINKCTNLIAA